MFQHFVNRQSCCLKIRTVPTKGRLALYFFWALYPSDRASHPAAKRRMNIGIIPEDTETFRPFTALEPTSTSSFLLQCECGKSHAESFVPPQPGKLVLRGRERKSLVSQLTFISFRFKKGNKRVHNPSLKGRARLHKQQHGDGTRTGTDLKEDQRADRHSLSGGGTVEDPPGA